LSKFINPGTADSALPAGNDILVPVREDLLSLAAAAGISGGLHTGLQAGTITRYTHDGSGPFNPPADNTVPIVTLHHLRQ
jgi:hypothetical protein